MNKLTSASGKIAWYISFLMLSLNMILEAPMQRKWEKETLVDEKSTKQNLSNVPSSDQQTGGKYGSINKDAPKETLQYGQFVGKWDVDVSNLTREGEWIHEKAEWVFKYILNGYALQDFWNKPATPTIEGSRNYLGTNIRIFNPASGKWKCSWAQNGNNDLNGVWTSFENEEGEIVLHDDSKQWQIKFFNIKKDSFDWKWDFYLEDGTLQTRSRIKARRIE